MDTEASDAKDRYDAMGRVPTVQQITLTSPSRTRSKMLLQPMKNTFGISPNSNTGYGRAELS
jgi:hypothetical protein